MAHAGPEAYPFALALVKIAAVSVARPKVDDKSRELSRAFATRLRAMPQERSWTQAELGERVGADGPVIRSYELKLHHPPRVTLRKLAMAFGVSVDFRLSGDAKPHEGFQDRELLDLFLKADGLHYTSKAALKQFIEGLLAAEKLRKAAS